MADMHQPTPESQKNPQGALPPSLAECRMPRVEAPSDVIPDIYESMAPANYTDSIASRSREQGQQEPPAAS